MPGDAGVATYRTGDGRDAARVVARLKRQGPVPAHLIAHADKLHMVGGISRLTPAATAPERDGVVILRGAGADDFDKRTWPPATVLGKDMLVDDPTTHLLHASVAIAAAGQNSVADLAVTNTPAIILPQTRPFSEQDATAAALDSARIAVVPTEFPGPRDWEGLFDQARQRAKNWHLWQTDGAAQRAATVIQNVANQENT